MRSTLTERRDHGSHRIYNNCQLPFATNLIQHQVTIHFTNTINQSSYQLSKLSNTAELPLQPIHQTRMPTYDPYISLSESEHIPNKVCILKATALPHPSAHPLHSRLIHRPSLSKHTPEFPKSYEEGFDEWDGPMWPGQDHEGLRKGETEVLPKTYRIPSQEPAIQSYEDGIDEWDGPIWPGQDHEGLKTGETEVLPKSYTITATQNDEIAEAAITSYEDGIDEWDGPLWPGQDHAGLKRGETQVLPKSYTITPSQNFEIAEAAITSYEAGIDEWDGPMWPNQNHAGLRKGETEVLPKNYMIEKSSSLSAPTISESTTTYSITSYEEGFDEWDGPMWPGQDHEGLRNGETEVLPEKWKLAKKEEIEVEIVGYEDGIDGWDGPLWEGQDHEGLKKGETEVLPAVYHIAEGLKLGKLEW